MAAAPPPDLPSSPGLDPWQPSHVVSSPSPLCSWVRGHFALILFSLGSSLWIPYLLSEGGDDSGQELFCWASKYFVARP